MRRRRAFAAFSIVVMALVIATSACSSSSSTSGAGAARKSAAPVTIGVLCSCSGSFGSSVTAAWDVFQAWVKSVNAADGINGHPVVLLEKDDASSPATSLTNAEAVIAAKVQLIVDLDVLDAVWAKAASAANIPVIGGNISGEPFYSNPDFYPSGQTNDSSIYASFATAKTAGASKLGLMNCAEGCTAFLSLQQSTAKAMGIPVVYTGTFAATAPNYVAQCLAAKQAGAQALYLGGSIAVIARVASDCTDQGYDPIYVTEGAGFTDQALTAPGLKDHLWTEFPVLPYFASSSAVSAMDTAVDKYFPGLRNNDLAWSEFAVQAWTGGLLIQAAAKNAGLSASDTVTSAAFTKGLNMVSNDTLDGFAPSLTFRSEQPHPVDCWYTARVQSGKATQIGGQTCHSSS